MGYAAPIRGSRTLGFTDMCYYCLIIPRSIPVETSGSDPEYDVAEKVVMFATVPYNTSQMRDCKERCEM